MENFNLKKAQLPEFKNFEKLIGYDKKGNSIGANSFYITKNNEPFFVLMGEFHISRCDCRFWEEEILKIKACGINTISSYLFWCMHEEIEGEFDFTGSLDIRRFVELCKKHNMYFLLRVGPFVNGEVENGGLPGWLRAKSFEVRSNDEEYLNYVKRYYDEVGKQLKGLYFKDDGPIIGVQLENEYGTAAPPWTDRYTEASGEHVPIGKGGDEHMMALKKFAVEAGMITPLYTVTGWGSPVPYGEMLPLMGGYPYPSWHDAGTDPKPSSNYVFEDLRFDPKPKWYVQKFDAKKHPHGYCELSGGGMSTYNHRVYCEDGAIRALSIAAVAMEGNVLGYYMFHGGTHRLGKFGYTNGCQWNKRSYDYQAPVREFGSLSSSYYDLKELFAFIDTYDGDLCKMAMVKHDEDKDDIMDNTRVRACVRTDGDKGFVFVNNFQDHVEMKDIEDVQFVINAEKETIKIPYKGTFTFKKDNSAVFPFNMMLQGVKVKYATVQPITFINQGKDYDYYFEKQEKTMAQYAFVKSDVKEIECASCKGEEVDGLIIVTLEEEKNADFTVVDKDSNRICVHTYVKSETDKMWYVNIGGKKHIVFSDSTVLQDSDSSIKFLSKGNTEISAKVYPEIEKNLSSDMKNFSCENRDGATYISINVPEPKAEINVKAVNDTFAEIKAENVEFKDGLENIYANITYYGDILKIYKGNVLVSDDYNNGHPWIIGLNQFADNGTVSLNAKILPLKNKAKKNTGNMEFASYATFSGDSLGAFVDINFVSEFAAKVSF